MQMNFNGELEFAGGVKYLGSIHDGLPDGEGAITMADGTTYSGEWNKGLLTVKRLTTEPAGRSDLSGKNIFHDSEKIVDARTDGYVISDDWIYTMGFYGPYKDQIIKIRIDGSGFSTIDEYIASDYLVAGEWIYHNSGLDKGYNLYKIKIDGSERKKLNEDETGVFHEYNGLIYYINGDDHDRIYSISVDGLDRKKICNDGAFDFYVANDRIYYINKDDKHSIFSINTDGCDRIKLLDDTVSGIEKVVDDWIIYNKYKYIYRCNTDGAMPSIVINEHSSSCDTDGQYIYYINEDDDQKIYRVCVDGTCRLKISNSSAMHLKLYKDWVFYSNSLDGFHIHRVKADSCAVNIPLVHTDTTAYCDVGSWRYQINTVEAKSAKGDIIRLHRDSREQDDLYEDWYWDIIVDKQNIYIVYVEYNIDWDDYVGWSIYKVHTNKEGQTQYEPLLSNFIELEHDDEDD